LGFNLSIYVRNIEDGWQIIEQIIPIFNPDYTLTLDLVSTMGIKKDIPVILNKIRYTVDDEGAYTQDTTRVVVFDLAFTVKAMLFGPISDSKIITKANTNIYGTFNSGTSGGSSIFVLNLQAGGFSTFKTGELIWQGGTYQFPDAKAEVIEFDATNRKLYIKDVYGSKNSLGAFVANVEITGASSGASWNVATSYVSNIKLIIGTVVPDPTSANVNSDFGFTETIIEFPNTLGL